MPGGSWRSVLEMAACTSCAAASMFRESANWSVILVPPMVLDDVIASMPALVEDCFSSGVAPAAAIDFGSGGESQLPVGHGERAGRHAGDDAEAVECALHRDGLTGGRAVVVHDEYIRALLALHHGLTRHHDGVSLRAQDERDIDV